MAKYESGTTELTSTDSEGDAPWDLRAKVTGI